MESKTIVYILKSERNPFRRYTGVTSDITRRLQWHNSGQNVSTADDRPWSVHVASFFERGQGEAIRNLFEERLGARVCEAPLRR